MTRLPRRRDWLQPALFAMAIPVMFAVASRRADAQGTSASEAPAALTAENERCGERIQSERRALDLAPGDVARQLELARTLALCQQYNEAIARFYRAMETKPGDLSAMAELGDALLRAHRHPEAAQLFRRLLRLDPTNLSAQLGLARALAATGNNLEALLLCDEVLKREPANYDALQGEAFVLFYMRRYQNARAVFAKLRKMNPADQENSEALHRIGRAEAELRSEALRPPPDAPPQALVDYYQHRLAVNPGDKTLLLDLARSEAQINDYQASIEACQQALALDPSDPEANSELARVLAWNHQYDASIKLYRQLLDQRPDNLELLDGFALVELWSGNTKEAELAYQRLSDHAAGNIEYSRQLARLALRLHDDAAARLALGRALAVTPRDHDSRLLLAELQLAEREWQRALEGFDQILASNPHDADALYGKARVFYYEDYLQQAYAAASESASVEPSRVDGLLLLARIERGRSHPRAAVGYLDRAERLAPNDPEIAEVRGALASDRPLILRTTFSYARDISQAGEDLRAFDYGTNLEFSAIPKTNSVLSFDYLPSTSPAGGIRGAAGPDQFLYRQTTYVSRRLVLGGGVGLVRFGPGDTEGIPSQSAPITSAWVRPIGFVGLSVSRRKELWFDLNWTRSALTSTPTSVRLGVIDQRFEGRLNYRPDSLTEVHLEYFHGSDFSEAYTHVKFINPQTVISTRPDRLHFQGASALVSHRLVKLTHFSAEAGYDGQVYTFTDPSRPYLGFYAPGRYQRHLLTTRFFGRVWGPFGYDFSDGIGIQQVERRAAITRALLLSPTLKWRASKSLTLGLGYTYYDYAQSLGELRGNAVRLTSEWKF